jgi:hypothetical protein
MSASEVNQGAGDEVLFDVFTPPRTPAMTRPEKVIVKAPKGPELELHKDRDFDALFWTASAIEKFVLPYYHAQRLLTPEQMAKLMEAYQRADIVAIAHMAPSKPYAIRDAFQVMGKGPQEQPWMSLLSYVSTL